MYLQITTRCNMRCDHCGFSHSPSGGKHMDYHLAVDAIKVASNYGDSIDIGGGEPTLHPRFFDIIKHALWSDSHVWLATNGKRTKTMRRLSNIIDEMDYGEDEPIFSDSRLSVALSQDPWHLPINPEISNLWRRRAKIDQGGLYQIRDASLSSDGLIDRGRAKRLGIGSNTNHCFCPDHLIQPDGYIRGCGCATAPVIGSVWGGIDCSWQDRLNNDQIWDDKRCTGHMKG